MKNSTSSTVNGNDGRHLIWICVVWILYLYISGLPNLLLCATILRYKALRRRKEYLIVCGLSLADFLEITFSYFSKGVHRLWLIYTNQWSSTCTAWSCLILPHNVLSFMTTPISVLMLIVASLDRLYVISKPLKYKEALSAGYAYVMLGITFGFGVFMGALAIGLGFVNDNAKLSYIQAPCFLGPVILASTNRFYFAYFFNFFEIGAVISVVLYLVVGIVYWKTKKTRVTNHTPSITHQLERNLQRSLTKSLAISALCTVVFVVIPLKLAHAVEFVWPRIVLQILYLLPPINPVCNFFIYCKRQKYLRKGINAFLDNKQMPDLVNIW